MFRAIYFWRQGVFRQSVGSTQINPITLFDVIFFNILICFDYMCEYVTQFTVFLRQLRLLHGEELCYEGNFKGYGVVAVNGFGVGGVKIVQGKMNNLYPRGLRI